MLISVLLLSAFLIFGINYNPLIIILSHVSVSANIEYKITKYI